uniref:Putative secreted protein n=2 Tax=Anopheles triannulatus TaxID=58253 RepID=A0A2M4AVR8_9DIPT
MVRGTPVLWWALGLLAVVQVPGATAKPDFGINFPITGSGKVSKAIVDANTVLMALDDNTELVTKSGYPGLQTLVDTLRNISIVLVSVGSELPPLGLQLVANNSNNISGAFDPVYGKILALNQTISVQLPPTISIINDIIGHYVPDMLKDGFDRVVVGLIDITKALMALQSALNAAVLQAGNVADVTVDILKQHVELVHVYQLVFFVNQLRAYLPVVKFSVDSTLENIAMADKYLLLVQQALGTTDTHYQNLTAGVENVTDAIAATVQAEFGNHSRAVAAIQRTAVNVTKLASPIASFRTHTDSLTTVYYPKMRAALQALLDVLQESLTGNATPGIFWSNALDSLILTLIENGGYAQFCFYKYYGLVFGTITAISDSVDQCFDREIPRLQQLNDLLPSLILQLQYDYEDLLAEIAACTALAPYSMDDSCLTTLSGFYADIATQFGKKLKVVFDVISNATVSSAKRYLICVELLKLIVMEGNEVQMTDDIRQCALGGPKADD